MLSYIYTYIYVAVDIWLKHMIVDSVPWNPDLPPIDIFDHEKSELPKDGWSFDLAGSNNGISPGLPVPDQDVNDSTNLSQPLAAPVANRLPELVDEATGVDNLSCNDFSQLPECEFASMGELHGMPQQLEIPAVGGSSIKRKRRGQHVSISGKTRDMDTELSPELLPAIEIPVVGGEQARPAVGRRQKKRTNKVDQAGVRFAF